MGRHDRTDGMRRFDDDSDSTIAELLRRAYARRVGVDTAARHLWAVDAAARSLRRSRRAARTRRTMVAALASIMLVAGAGGAIAASTGTLPGDALYTVKLGTERVRLALALSPQADAHTHLAIARTRWDEAQRAAEDRPGVVPGLLSQMFAALDAAEARGGRAGDAALALRSQVTGLSTELAFGSGPAAEPPARSGARREPEHLVSPPTARVPAGDRAGASGDEGTAGRIPADRTAPDGDARNPAPDEASTAPQESSPSAPSPAAGLPPPEAATPPPQTATPAPDQPAPTTVVDQPHQPQPDQPASGEPHQPAPERLAGEDADRPLAPTQSGPEPAGEPATEAGPGAPSAPSPGWGRPRP